MTYTEVTKTGAEILEAFAKVPTEGWTELAVEQVRQIHEEATQQVKHLERGFNAAAHEKASLVMRSSEKALARAQAGGRVFSARFPDGDIAFAATKTA